MSAKYTPPPAFPLAWPEGRERTPAHKRQASKFDCTFAQARDGLGAEIVRLGGRYSVLSTNLPLNLSGLPYASRGEPADPGVAAYFEYKGKSMCFACDRWSKVKDNIRAIEKTIDAIRGIQRWGSGEMLDRAINAFQALAAPTAKRSWREVLGLQHHRAFDRATVEEAWRYLAKTHHPDKGGDPAKMAEINAARDEALKELAG